MHSHPMKTVTHWRDLVNQGGDVLIVDCKTLNEICTLNAKCNEECGEKRPLNIFNESTWPGADSRSLAGKVHKSDYRFLLTHRTCYNPLSRR